VPGHGPARLTRPDADNGDIETRFRQQRHVAYRGYANKLLKLQNDLVQTLDRRQRGNSQSIVVKHVHIHPGAQGVVGIVNHDEGQRPGGDQN
jgi:hypothetical protein